MSVSTLFFVFAAALAISDWLFSRLLDNGFNHLVEFSFHFRREVGLNLINVSKLSECPPAVRGEMVDSRDPIYVHRRFFLFRIFASVSLYFHNQVQQVFVSVGVLHAHNEIWPIQAVL